MIDKNDQVRVGGTSGIDPVSGLPMFRRFKSFEANRELEFIRTWYDEYLQYPTGVNTIPVTKYYDVKNIPEVLDDNEAIIIAGNSGFDNWYNYTLVSQMTGMHMGKDIIVGAINATLAIIPFDAPNGYVHL